ncbi:DegT/DnrJ/EryC1/StrS aminotransferase family protein [Arthrobacter sp. PAMC25284]|uniref:DegT/DnrJ/EryC1/StrS family aminotransferase n=1 Tax=Arthrobacter sp. PAMC25284 TaxID=2861279 RepID=UPI001C630E25|nr:DegT/DnrJ/EryC1/StrS family aminotransferase [Arthrobacter sp. PAMC25284]QYF89558.1 DegT/DnrJ/EryC1/StrS family aminotransferase [Arthrobacter sp. PAMC25284]
MISARSATKPLDDELARPPRDVGPAELQPIRLRELAERDPAAFRRLCARLSRWPIITAEDELALTEYIRSGPMSVIDPGQGVSGELLKEFQRRLGLRRSYGLTVNSATNGLHAAYRAVGVGPGVLVAAIGYTFHATVTPALDLGAHPILMDVDPVTGNLRYEEVLRTLDAHPDVQAIGLNHNWGVPCADIGRIAELARSRGIPLIEDCSHAHGASVDGIPVGGFGTVSVFSMQSKKLVPGGEGGLCFTDDAALHAAMLLVGHYGFERPGPPNDESLQQTGLGGLQNRIHPLAAVLALSQLRRLDRVLRNREENAARLREALRDVPYLSFPEPPAAHRTSYYAFRARFEPEGADGAALVDVVATLRRAGAPVGLDRGGPLSRKTIYRKQIDSPISRLDPARPLYTDRDLPNATEFCRRSIILPVFSRDPAVVGDAIDVIADLFHASRKALP